MKAKKFPKMPKESASIAVWEKFDKKCREIIAYNRKLQAEKKKASAKKTAEQKRKKTIVSRVKKMIGKM